MLHNKIRQLDLLHILHVRMINNRQSTTEPRPPILKSSQHGGCEIGLYIPTAEFATFDACRTRTDLLEACSFDSEIVI